VLNVVWLIPALPLLGFAVLLLFGKRIGEPYAGWLATAMVGSSFLVALGVFADLASKSAEERAYTKVLWSWLPSLGVDVALLVNPLSIVMVLFVTGIATLIHVFAIGYMHGDSRFPRFFTYLNLFVFSMLMLVLADNFVLMFLGWEGVGACSYLLISFWFERPSAATAGKKAFVVNRIGDFGLMGAMFLIFKQTGSLQYHTVFRAVESNGIKSSTAIAICALLFVGACGKSAQLPLYVWLPDAMEGPTPVSALIHAATMVTAGVYLMVRVHPLLEQAPEVLTVIAWVGALTALFAATIATAQDDIKRVLAYSTISQLGYMFLAVGVGGNVAAIFHMITHAFFKALMFLAAGSVIHGMHGVVVDEQNMKWMGNLKKWMPITTGTFLIGWVAIAGVPPFAGFWSKDEILLDVYKHSKPLWIIGLATALLTAYYMTRQIILVFFGKERFATDAHAVDAHATDAHAVDGGHDAHAAHTPHESPILMLLPLGVLATLSILGGLINQPFGGKSIGAKLEHWLEEAFIPGTKISSFVAEHEKVSSGTKLTLALIATACGLIGIAMGVLLWLKRTTPEAQAKLEVPLLRRAYGVDGIYSAIVEKPGRKLSEFLAFVVDRKGIDGAVNGVAALVKGGGTKLRKTQNGYVRTYAVSIAAGAVALLVWALVRTGL
jgi:NADH-quinone oxidoreductase subunit L